MYTIINTAGASKKALSKWAHLLDREDLTIIHQQSRDVPWLLIRDEEGASMYIGEQYAKYNVHDIHPANLQALQSITYRATDAERIAEVVSFGMFAYIVEYDSVNMVLTDPEQFVKAVSRITGSNVDLIQVGMSQEGELRITHGKHKIFHRSVDNSWWHLTASRRNTREQLYIDCLIELKG